MSGCPLKGQPEDHLVHRALLLLLILTNCDRRAEVPKRGQDHKSCPSRCLVGRLCPPDKLQVLTYFLSILFPPPACNAPGIPIGLGLRTWAWISKLEQDPQRRLIWRKALEGKQNGHFGDYLLIRLVCSTGFEHGPSLWTYKAMTNTTHGHYLPALAPEFGVHRWHFGTMSKIHVEMVELEISLLSWVHWVGWVGG